MLCSLQSLLTMTAPSYMILSATLSTNNLPDKTLTFLAFCQMFGPAAAAVVPQIPWDNRQELLPKRSHSEIPQGPLIVIRKVFGRGLAPSQATANQLSTPINEHTACVKVPFFVCTHLKTTHLIRFHLISRWQVLYICSSLITLTSNTSVSSLYALLYSTEPVNLFQPSFHMLLVTRRCDDAPVQLVVGGEPLTPAANLMACRLEGEEECCEGATVMEEVGVSKGVIRPDSMPSYCAVGYDLNPPAVHSHSLFPHPASNPNTPFVIHPSSASPCPTHTTVCFRLTAPREMGEGSGAIPRRWRIQTVRGGEEDSPCRPEVCLPDTV